MSIPTPIGRTETLGQKSCLYTGRMYEAEVNKALQGELMQFGRAQGYKMRAERAEAESKRLREACKDALAALDSDAVASAIRILHEQLAARSDENA